MDPQKATDNKAVRNNSKKKILVGDYQLRIVSMMPPAYSIKGLISAETLDWIEELIINAGKEQRIFSSINTSSGSIVQENRVNIPVSLLEKIDPEYTNVFMESFNSKELFRTLWLASKEILAYSIGNNRKKAIKNYYNKKLVLRIRSCLDKRGFYIPPHNDSLDTLITLIMPLMKGGTATSLFVKAPQRLERIKGQPGNVSLVQHADGVFMDVIDEPKTIRMIKKIDQNKYKVAENYYFQSVDLDHGDAIVLVNANSNLWNCNEGMRTFNTKNSFHGIYPPIKEALRPILMIDLLHCDNKQTVNKDENAFLIELGSVEMKCT